MAIKRERVASSAIRGIGHDKESKRLDVQFRKSGAVYRYHDVGTRAANNLKNASSVGRHFVRNVRNRYDYTKIQAGETTRGRKRKR